MRSGQYKLTASPPKVVAMEKKGISSGNFKMASKEFPLLSPVPQNEECGTIEFYNLDSLQRSVIQRLDEKEEMKGTESVRKKFKEHIYKGSRKRDSILRHKSCENVSLLSKGTVTRVEQKVRSLLRVDSKWSNGDASELRKEREACIESLQTDLWPAGKIISTSRKPRLIGSHSHSALHTISTTSSDSASCLSASSGYSSSSSSSSYGSFKSTESVCSSLPRHRNSSSGSQSVVSDQNNRILFVDNPLYDIIPVSNFSQLDDSNAFKSLVYEKFPEDASLPEVNINQSYSAITDPIAKQCIEFFENRLSSSETLRRKWNLYVSEPMERYNSINSDLISKGDAVIDSKFNAGFDSDMSLGVESNFSLVEELSEESLSKSSKKNELDKKMEFLRQEIASLILQDNTLFKQLLTLHESIATLKVRSAISASESHIHLNQASNLRSHSPSDLESFTEEDEFEGFEQRVNELQLSDDSNSHCSALKIESCLRNEDEEEEEENKTTLEAEYNNNNNNNSNNNSNNNNNDEDDEEEDEGHGTDLSSLGQSSSSPSSTLSSNSSEGITFSRNLYSEMTSDLSGSFTRCRKSYAPNARNRRRSSSVSRQKTPTLECGTTTALVVIYADDEDILLNSNRQRSHSFSPLTTCTIHDALTYAESKKNSKLNSLQSESESLGSQNSSLNNEGKNHNTININKGNLAALISCSTETTNSLPLSGAKMSTHSHPPFREALIM